MRKTEVQKEEMRKGEEEKVFCERLLVHARNKAELWDGVGSAMSPEESLQLITEEVGEVAGALNRGRRDLAKEEAVDVAHTAMLLYISLDNEEL